MKALITAGAALAAIVGIVFAIMAVFAIGVFSNAASARYNRAVLHSKVQQKVYDPTKAIADYEQFFQDCTAIQATNEQIAAARERLDALKSTPDDAFGQKASRVADAATDVAGLEQNRASIAARYNAAAQEQTRAVFKDAGLPSEIGPPYIVTCKAIGGTP